MFAFFVAMAVISFIFAIFCIVYSIRSGDEFFDNFMDDLFILFVSVLFSAFAYNEYREIHAPETIENKGNTYVIREVEPVIERYGHIYELETEKDGDS